MRNAYAGVGWMNVTGCCLHQDLFWTFGQKQINNNNNKRIMTRNDVVRLKVNDKNKKRKMKIRKQKLELT
jgi:hypothetical protein